MFIFLTISPLCFCNQSPLVTKGEGNRYSLIAREKAAALRAALADSASLSSPSALASRPSTPTIVVEGRLHVPQMPSISAITVVPASRTSSTGVDVLSKASEKLSWVKQQGQIRKGLGNKRTDGKGRLGRVNSAGQSGGLQRALALSSPRLSPLPLLASS